MESTTPPEPSSGQAPPGPSGGPPQSEPPRTPPVPGAAGTRRMPRRHVLGLAAGVAVGLLVPCGAAATAGVVMWRWRGDARKRAGRRRLPIAESSIYWAMPRRHREPSGADVLWPEFARAFSEATGRQV